MLLRSFWDFATSLCMDYKSISVWDDNMEEWVII